MRQKFNSDPTCITISTIPFTGLMIVKNKIICLALVALMLAKGQASECKKCTNWVQFHVLYSTKHDLDWEEVWLQVLLLKILINFYYQKLYLYCFC